MTNTIADYHLGLVLLSYAVSVLGALTGLFVASYIRREHGGAHFGWLLLAAVLIGGCAIWSMHFIGMLAYDPGTPIAYDTRLTGISLVIPIVFAFFGLYCVTRWWENLPAILIAGVITGLGVASMHYTGMASVRIEAYMHHDPFIVGLSVVIAILASIAALYVVVHVRGPLRYASSLVMGLAVCGMHYTGMAAMELEPADIEVEFFAGALSPSLMAVAVTLAVGATCAIGGIVAGSRWIEERG